MDEVLGREGARTNPVTGEAAAAPLSVSEAAGVIGAALERLGAPAAEGTAERLARYHALLTDWNTRMNLTGDTDLTVCLDRLYLDSLAPLKTPGLFPAGARVIDVGTGAGIPGLMLAIARPDLRVTLLDALSKRIRFLEAAAAELGLSNVTMIHARAEDAARDPALREKFDVAAARAVAPLNVLCELLLPFARTGGSMVCYKGPSAAEELAAAGKASALCGGGPLTVIPVEIPSRPEWQHCVVRAEKRAATPKRFPRKAGTPAKEPLG